MTDFKPHKKYIGLSAIGVAGAETGTDRSLLIPGALSRGDLVLASGDKCFWHRFRDILGQQRVYFLDATSFDDGGNKIRWSIVEALDSARDCDRPPAAIVRLDRRSRNYEWFRCEASAVFDAINPTIARVLHVRDFADRPERRLRIDGHKIVCEVP